MFGYVIPNQAALSPEAQARYRTAYCGLCRRIGALHGLRGRLTLSYDLTFLNLLLSSLYEGETECVQGCGHCPIHPVRKIHWRSSGPTDYCADLSVALHYYNAQDKWNDDHSLLGLGFEKLLAAPTQDAAARWPRQCEPMSNPLPYDFKAGIIEYYRQKFGVQHMKQIEIYTDGACSGNPGPGGWGAILRFRTAQKVYEKELSGGEANTTNNRMEMTALLEALRQLKEPCAIDLYSDSKYVIDSLQKGWAKGWRARGWKKADKSPALNPDLWAPLLAESEKHEITYHWLKGHAGHPENERCDRMAVEQSKKYGGRQA